MKKFYFGILFGTLGIAALSSAADIIYCGAEIIKAKIGVKIAECNAQINQLTMPETEIKAIGFATTEENDYGT